jgi:drug/metabolite transporter (DMT)-like permease
VELVFVFGRLIFSLASNVYQKKLAHQGLHPFYIVATTYCVLSLLALPLLSLISISDLSQGFWLNVFLASLLDVGGWMFLVMSLSKTDLSVFGPLNAYKVIVTMLLAMVFLHEIPSRLGLAGVVIIITGSFFLLPSQPKLQTGKLLRLFGDKGVQARFLSIVLFSIGTIFLKKSVVYGGALETLLLWSLIGLPLVLLSNFLFMPEGMGHQLKTSKQHMHTLAGIGAMVFAMQYLTLVLLGKMLVVYALALFQLGMMLQVLIGYRLFNEQNIRRKLLASLVMMLGSVLVLMT